MSIETTIRSLLIADTTPTNAIAGDRVYLGAADQDERRPRVVLTLLSQSTERDFNGSANVYTGSLQAACLAGTYKDAFLLAEAVDDVLDDYTGNGNGITIDFIEVDDVSDIESSAPPGQPRPTFGRAVNLKFIFQKTGG